MRTAFLLGSASLSGGIFVIYEYALRLRSFGHDVVLIFEGQIAQSELSWHPHAASLPRKTLEQAMGESFDIVIATWWRTAYDLYKIQSQVYGYFVQSIESRFYPETDRAVRETVNLTYDFPCRFVTEATWIQRYLLANYGVKANLVRNGIRKDLFSASGKFLEPRPPNKLRMLVEGPLNVPFKNVEKTLALCRLADVGEIWLLTSSSTKSVDNADRVFSCVPVMETSPIYRSCDVLVKLSYVEGMFGPPLEMFHCGGTAIVYDITGAEEYIRHNDNALMAPVNDEGSVVQFLKDLQQNAGLLARLKDGAARTARAWPDWDMQATLFEGVLKSWLGSPQHSGFSAQTRKLLTEATETAIADSGGLMNSLPQTSEMLVRDRLRRYNRETDQLRDVVVFGTGSCAGHVRTYLDSHLFRLIGYFDNNPDRIGRSIDGVCVYAPHLMPGVTVIIASQWAAEMRNQLSRLGYDSAHIFSVLPE
jgi:O-antigen biosynthesis protein